MRRIPLIVVAALAALTLAAPLTSVASAASLAKKVKALQKKVKKLEGMIGALGKQGPQGPAGATGPAGSQGPKGDKPSANEYLAAINIQASASAANKAPMLGTDGRLDWNAFPFATLPFSPKTSTTTQATATCPPDPDGPQMYVATAGGGRATAGGNLTGSFPSDNNGSDSALPTAWTVTTSLNGAKAFVVCTLLYSNPF